MPRDEQMTLRAEQAPGRAVGVEEKHTVEALKTVSEAVSKSLTGEDVALLRSSLLAEDGGRGKEAGRGNRQDSSLM